jgi:tetratricopeptide (TPR) repeat protein
MHRLLHLLFALLPALAVHAQINNRLDAVQLIQQGDMLLRLGNSEQALLQYTNAIQMDMGFADAYMKRASLLSRLGQYTQALADMDRALALNPYSEYIYDRRAKLRLLVNDVKGAQEDWSVAIALHPYDELVREHRADAWLEVGDLDRALNELDTLLQRDPADAMLLLKRGIVELQLGNAPAAGEWFQRAHRHAPGLALVYSLRAVSLMKQQRWKEALPLLDTALTLDPHFDLAHYDRGLVHLSWATTPPRVPTWMRPSSSPTTGRTSSSNAPWCASAMATSPAPAMITTAPSNWRPATWRPSTTAPSYASTWATTPVPSPTWSASCNKRRTTPRPGP